MDKGPVPREVIRKHHRVGLAASFAGIFVYFPQEPGCHTKVCSKSEEGGLLKRKTFHATQN